MSLPNLPPFYQMPVADKDGKISGQFSLFQDQTFQVLNAAVILLNGITNTAVNSGTVTINGINPPSLSTTQINTLLSTASIGTIWHNYTLNKLQFAGNGNILQTISSS